MKKQEEEDNTGWMVKYHFLW